ncbi:MAG TPA: ABC transporter permease [Puia sp.]|uniref:ABC transporter permease n=1 Tax=Puia sp. TaxID=2045100 RepID=UPI002CCA4098|nr:ABC transporter permease [Puia sp.]HVU96510.1 ABC transporter permease [Puia sp.]
MIKNYFTIAWRNLMKSKVFSIINVLGLTIGITVCMMIFLFVLHEMSFDKFHKQSASIYRVMRNVTNDNKEVGVGWLSGPYGPALANDFKGQITRVVRVRPDDDLITIDNRSFHERKIIWADSNFFCMFSFPLLRGDTATALRDLPSVVLSETIAKKYFGGADNAMGKTIQVAKDKRYRVTAVMKDVPANSHLDFELVFPLENRKDDGVMTGWINNGLYTYVQLAPTTTQAQMEKQFPGFVEKYMGAMLRKYGFHFALSLVPLQKVYLDNTAFDGIRHGDISVVYVFLSIAALILLIGCINFINLSTVRAAERSKEVGLRKVLGALRGQIIKQFIGESLLVTVIACVLSLGLLSLVMPFYNHVLGYSLQLTDHFGALLAFCGGIIVVVGILAGSYPAFFLSNFTPFEALKGKLRLGRGAASFRQGLVVIQFSISVFLIFGTIMVTKQMDFIKHKQLGYDKEQTVMIPIDNNDIYQHLQSFRLAMQNSAGIASFSAMSGEPGGFHDIHVFDVEGHTGKVPARTEFSDFEFVPTLGLKIIAGRNFSAQYPTDTTNAVLINRTAAVKFGWTPDQAIGKWIQNTVRDDKKRYIVGVIEDYNFLSLKEEMAPLVISPAFDRRMILVKIKSGQLSPAIAAIKKEYAVAAPGYPLEYRFLDQQFGEIYRNNLRQQSILTVFAGLAIFVACLGLFGLASFTAAKRVKEIGVRKVLGSSVENIVVLLSRDLLKPVIIATAIAIPIGFWVMKSWLQNFAYQTSMSLWVFVVASLATFLIALLTVSFKAVGAARANPSKSLRSE